MQTSKCYLQYINCTLEIKRLPWVSCLIRRLFILLLNKYKIKLDGKNIPIVILNKGISQSSKVD